MLCFEILKPESVSIGHLSVTHSPQNIKDAEYFDLG